MARNPTALQWKFIKAAARQDAPNFVEAARVAGFKHPSEEGSKLGRKLMPYIEAEREKSKSLRSMSAEEVLEGLQEIARDSEHRSRYDALMALAKIHGLTDSKRNPGDRKVLESQLDETLLILRGKQPNKLPAAS